MSRIATDWAWNQQVKPASLKILLLSMADRADEYHRCYPSIARLVKDTCLDKKTVQSGLIKLQEQGLAKDTGEKVGPTKRVRVFQLIITDETTRGNLPKNGNVPKSGNIPKNGKLNDPKNGKLNDPENGIQNQSLEPVIEPNKKKGKTSQLSELDFSAWPSEPSPQVLKDWVEVRKGKRALLTQTAVNRMAKALHQAAAVGLSVDDCLGICAERGWLSIEFAWLVNAGYVTQQVAPQAGDWTADFYDEEDPLV